MNSEERAIAQQELDSNPLKKAKFTYITNLLDTLAKGDTANKLYTCVDCRRSFHQQFDFAVHFQEKHGKDPIQFRVFRDHNWLSFVYSTDAEHLADI